MLEVIDKEVEDLAKWEVIGAVDVKPIEIIEIMDDVKVEVYARDEAVLIVGDWEIILNWNKHTQAMIRDIDVVESIEMISILKEFGRVE